MRVKGVPLTDSRNDQFDKSKNIFKIHACIPMQFMYNTAYYYYNWGLIGVLYDYLGHIKDT